jgi:hypothetical protein
MSAGPVKRGAKARRSPSPGKPPECNTELLCGWAQAGMRANLRSARTIGPERRNRR